MQPDSKQARKKNRYTEYTQKTGAVSIVNTIETKPFFCVCPVYIYDYLKRLVFISYYRRLLNWWSFLGYTCQNTPSFFFNLHTKQQLALSWSFHSLYYDRAAIT
jgi:hypothetical protein